MEGQPEFISAAVSAPASDKLSTAIITLLLTFILHLCTIPFQNSRGLRVLTFRSKNRVDNYPEPYCAVCLHDIADGERYRKLPGCEHCFHVECIDAWFESRATCPLCRNEVFVRRNHGRRRRGLLGYVIRIIFRKIGSYLDVDVTCD